VLGLIDAALGRKHEALRETGAAFGYFVFFGASEATIFSKRGSLALESRVLRCAEAGQRGELIDSEGVLPVELCESVMFANRIRQGHKLFFAHTN
jgi:hypothetical protein